MASASPQQRQFVFPSTSLASARQPELDEHMNSMMHNALNEYSRIKNELQRIAAVVQDENAKKKSLTKQLDVVHSNIAQIMLNAGLTRHDTNTFRITLKEQKEYRPVEYKYAQLVLGQMLPNDPQGAQYYLDALFNGRHHIPEIKPKLPLGYVQLPSADEDSFADG